MLRMNLRYLVRDIFVTLGRVQKAGTAFWVVFRWGGSVPLNQPEIFVSR